MNYKQFSKSLLRSGVCESIKSYNHLIERLETNHILIDGELTEFSSIKEAREFIKQCKSSQSLEELAAKELYEELSDKTIATIIIEHHGDVRVTDTLVESYKELASSHAFSVDPVVQKIRQINKLDRLVENKINYVLNDKSIIAISEATQERLNNLLQNQTDIIEYMRESKNNFMYVLDKLEGN